MRHSTPRRARLRLKPKVRLSRRADSGLRSRCPAPTLNYEGGGRRHPRAHCRLSPRRACRPLQWHSPSVLPLERAPRERHGAMLPPRPVTVPAQPQACWCCLPGLAAGALAISSIAAPDSEAPMVWTTGNVI